jgi:stage V sporulation protein B
MHSNLAKSALLVTISEIIFNLSGYIIHSAVGRILGPADYGRYGLVVTLTTMVIILIGNGIPTAMAKYISEIFESNPRLVGIIKKKAIILQTIIVGTITVVFFFASPAIAFALNDPSLTKLFRISTLIIPAFAMASFYFSYYTGLHKFNIQSGLKISRSIFRVIIIIALAYLYKVEGSVAGYIIAPFMVFLIAWTIDEFKVKKELKNKIAKLDEEKTRSLPASPAGGATARDDQFFPWKKLVDYAWQVIVFFLAYELLISIDLYLVKALLKDDYLTGIYNGALTVGRIPYYIFYALTVILLPVISKSTAENNHERTAKIISNSLRLMVVLLVPSIILMAVFSRPIIKIFYSAKYIDAAYPMSILVVGVGFLTIFYVLSFVMNGAGKTKIPMVISIFGVIVNAVLNYILIKKYGLVGSAIATSVTSFLVMIWMLYYLHRDFKVSFKIKNIFNVAVAGVLMYFLAQLFSQGQFLFILWSIILVAFYLLVLYLLKEIKKEDLEFFKGIVSKKKVTEVEEELPGTEPSA